MKTIASGFRINSEISFSRLFPKLTLKIIFFHQNYVSQKVLYFPVIIVLKHNLKSFAVMDSKLSGSR